MPLKIFDEIFIQPQYGRKKKQKEVRLFSNSKSIFLFKLLFCLLYFILTYIYALLLSTQISFYFLLPDLGITICIQKSKRYRQALI